MYNIDIQIIINKTMNEIIGLNPEETFLAESQLNKYEIDAKVETEGIEGTADRIMKVITKCECYDRISPPFICEKHDDTDETELAKEREEDLDDYRAEQYEASIEPVANWGDDN